MKLIGECLDLGWGAACPQHGSEAGVGKRPGVPKSPACLLSHRLLPALQLLLWHSALWTVQEATPLGPASNLPQSFLLKCLEQVRKIQADDVVLQERLVSDRGKQRAREGTQRLQPGLGMYRGQRTQRG